MGGCALGYLRQLRYVVYILGVHIHEVYSSFLSYSLSLQWFFLATFYCHSADWYAILSKAIFSAFYC